MHHRAIGLGIVDPLLEVVGQIGNRVGANLLGLIAKPVVIDARELLPRQRRCVIRGTRDRLTSEGPSHRPLGALAKGRGRQLEGAGLMRGRRPALRQRRAADLFLHAHAIASASTVARCTARTGLPSRERRPPSCMRQPGSAETSRSTPAGTNSCTLASAMATETSG